MKKTIGWWSRQKYFDDLQIMNIFVNNIFIFDFEFVLVFEILRKMVAKSTKMWRFKNPYDGREQSKQFMDTMVRNGET